MRPGSILPRVSTSSAITASLALCSFLYHYFRLTKEIQDASDRVKSLFQTREGDYPDMVPEGFFAELASSIVDKIMEIAR